MDISSNYLHETGMVLTHAQALEADKNNAHDKTTNGAIMCRVSYASPFTSGPYALVSSKCPIDTSKKLLQFTILKTVSCLIKICKYFGVICTKHKEDTENQGFSRQKFP